MNAQSDEKLTAWLENVKSFEPTPWNELPQLELYMDQVITLINREIETLLSDKDRGITPSMINNYVKAGTLPHPEQKRYNSEHLAMLTLICLLKAEFSIQDIRELLEVLTKDSDTETLYNTLTRKQTSLLKDTVAALGDAQSLSAAERCRLAAELAIDANAKRLAAARLLSSVIPCEEEKKDKDKDKKKKKES